MNRNLIVTVCLLLVSVFANAQTLNDTIAHADSIQKARYVAKVFRNDTIETNTTPSKPGKYWYKGEFLTTTKMGELLQNNSIASEYFKKYKDASGGLTVLGFVGGGLIGYPIGTYLGGGKPSWTMAYVGAGILAVAIPISIAASKNLSKAVQAFNDGRTTPAKTKGYSARIGLSANGLALAIRF